jgi:hypothetical protein
MTTDACKLSNAFFLNFFDIKGFELSNVGLYLLKSIIIYLTVNVGDASFILLARQVSKNAEWRTMENCVIYR